MRLYQAIRTQAGPDACRDLLSAYLEQAGYKLLSAESQLIYGRSRALGSSSCCAR